MKETEKKNLTKCRHWF